MHDSSREGSQPSLFLPILPLESKRLCTFQQRLVIELFPLRWETMGPALSLLTDGWPVWLYLSRTDTARLGPRDCHSWLLYQGLTLRAVILLEQGSQTTGSATPPPSCHSGTLAFLLASLVWRLPLTRVVKDVLTNCSRYTCSWVLFGLF